MKWIGVTDMIKLNGTLVTPTIFPDKTSQVWKLPEEALEYRAQHLVEWDFESEAELIHVLQLRELLNRQKNPAGIPYPKVILLLPYLPYGRQDKTVSNSNTFSLFVFLNVIEEWFDRIEVMDAHNPEALGPHRKFVNHLPNHYIKQTIDLTKPDLICFPDKGATKRNYDIGELPSFHLDKKRNQETGEIEGLKCALPIYLGSQTVLIVDDITDGGRTFIEASSLLYNMGASSVYLYTTHGLYTKGTSVLFDSGIKRIFNYKGEVKRGNLNDL